MIAKAQTDFRERCDNCKYFMAESSDWLDQVGKAFGSCRRYPPSAVGYGVDGDHIETTMRPLVRRSDWCGCFSQLNCEL